MATRGGRHQRKRLAEDTPSTPSLPRIADSPLAACLLNKWAWGQLSSADVQEIAHMATRTPSGCAVLEKLASLGAYGVHQNNLHRDLLHFVSPTAILAPETHSVPVPVEVRDPVKKKPETVIVEQSVFYLHEWLAQLGRDEASFEMVMGKGDDLEHFWRHVRPDDPHFEHVSVRALKEHVNYSRSVWPFVLHADAAEHKKLDSITPLSMRSLVATSSTLVSELLLCALPSSCRLKGKKNDCLGVDSWFSFWRVLKWDLDCVAAGRHPSLDVDGKPFPPGSKKAELAGEWLTPNHDRGLVWYIAADCDHLSNELWLPHASSLSPCMCCKANTSDVPFTDFRETALWRNCRRDEVPSVHPAFSCFGLSQGSLVYDTLHVLEQGPTSHVLGNALWMLRYEEKLSMDAINADLQDAYRCLATPSGYRVVVQANLFVDVRAPRADYPCLGKSIKARQVRYLLPAVHKVVEQVAAGHQGDQRWLQLSTALGALTLCYDILDLDTMFLTDSQFSSLTKQMQLFLLTYNALAKDAIRRRLKLFSVTAKFHYALHLAEQARYMAPRKWWCYPGEDFVGKIAGLAHSCLAGVPAHNVSHKLMEKYRVAMHLQFTHVQ
jgi:hypothetical protein